MSHYLTYVYGPEDKATLERVMKPYNEQWESTGSLRPDLVVLTNVPVFTLENTLYDLIQEFRKITQYASFNRKAPILLVDDAMEYLDMNSVQELGAFIISYDLDSKEATAKVVVTRGFWDWYQVGGRWPAAFKPRSEHGWFRNIVAEPDVAHGILAEDIPPKHYVSLPMRDIDWKTAIRAKVKSALEMWDKFHQDKPDLEPVSAIMKRMNLPKGVRYYDFDHREYDAWHKTVREISEKHSIDWGNTYFSPFDVAGMSRREVIRFAIARTYVPMYSVIWQTRFDQGLNGQVEETTVYDFAWSTFPTDEELRKALQHIRNLPNHTVVTAIDIHN